MMMRCGNYNDSKSISKFKIWSHYGEGGFLRQNDVFRPILRFFYEKVWLFQIKAVPLYHENPPSLFTMLKSAGRFILS